MLIPKWSFHGYHFGLYRNGLYIGHYNGKASGWAYVIQWSFEIRKYPKD